MGSGAATSAMAGGGVFGDGGLEEAWRQGRMSRMSTDLWNLCARGDGPGLMEALGRGEDPNTVGGSYTLTPLMVAACAGWMEVVAILLAHPTTDVNATGENDWS